jgi:ABC-type multidrug transport system fused ATPase/permease subunit
MNKKALNPLLRLIKNLKDNDPKLIFFCVLYTVAAVLVPLLSVAIPKLVIGELTGASPDISSLMYIVAGFFALGAVLYFSKNFINDFSYPRLTALRIGYIREQAVKLLKIAYKYTEDEEFSEKYSKAFQSTNTNNNGVEGIYHKLFDLPQLVLLTLALAVFIGLKSPLILLAIIINIVASSFVAIKVQKYGYSRKEAYARAERRVAYYSNTAQDFSYGKDVRLYDLKERVKENFKLEIKGYISVYKSVQNRQYALGFISLFTLLISDLAAYGILTYLTKNGMPIADYAMYIAAALSLTIQMTALSENITFIMNEYMYVKDLFLFLDADLGEKGGCLKAPPIDEKLEIEFKNVSFKYPGTERNIFSNFSLKIPKGQKLALVGINGAGKTTFVKLLTGLFKADSGSILINGADINDYQKDELFKLFAVVFQDVNILAFTVAENIACRSTGIDYEKVDEVLKKVGLYDKVQEFPNKTKQMMLKIIEEDGAVLSGGESQKLSIARALYKGGSCVIMDEPTAALDALAEAEIYQQFDALTEGKTSVYISHRLASTKFCDKIALIDNEGLREYGTHEELMSLGGAYFDMFMTQGKYYREGSEEK